MLWWKLIKVMFIIWFWSIHLTQILDKSKIHDLCKVSCLCSSYAFSLIWPNEFLNVFLLIKLIEVVSMKMYECISLCIFHQFERLFSFEKHFIVDKKTIVFTKQPIVFPLEHLNKVVMILMHGYNCFFSFKTHCE